MDFEPILRLWESGTPRPAPVTTEALADRYRGTLLGAAAGNLLGLPVEGASKRAMSSRFPNGLREIDPQERHRPWDDDLAQTVVLAEAILASGRIDIEDLGQRLVRWMKENGRGMGTLTFQVLAEIADGVPASEAASLVWESSGRQSAGNGAVMRCSPVALRWRSSPKTLVEESLRSARVTHYDPRCQWSAAAVNIAIARALEGWTIELSDLARVLDECGAPPSVADAIRFVAGHSLEDLELDNGGSMGYTLKTMQVGLWALTAGESLEDALVRVVRKGGDTDTNGAVAGAVLGAAHGASAIPGRWLECVPRREYLEHLAEQLLSASQSNT